MFPKSPDYKYVPYDIRKGERHHVSQPTNLGAPPPLILGFHPSKRHAALIASRVLIASRDQGSVVVTFTLVLLVLSPDGWQSMLPGRVLSPRPQEFLVWSRSVQY